MRPCSVCGLVAVPLLRGMCGGCYTGSRPSAPRTSKVRRPRTDQHGSGWAFTEQQVIALRAEYQALVEAGEDAGYITRRAARLRVARSTLANAVRGVTYRWVK